MSRAVHVVGTIAVAALVLVCTACTSVQHGNAQPGLRSTTTTVSPAVPTVVNPLSTAALSSDPCRLLSPTQLADLGLTSAATANRDETSVMVGCDWSDSTIGAGVQLNVSWVTPLHRGLADIYVRQAAAAYWQPITVAGYPAVLTATTDERDSGTCGLYLGASNTAVINVLYQGTSGTSDPCGKAQALAAEIVSSLKGRS